MFDFLGPVTVHVEPEHGALDVRFVHVNSVVVPPNERFDDHVVTADVRNNHILQDARDLAQKHERKVLILTSRVEHALSLWEQLKRESREAFLRDHPVFQVAVIVGDLADSSDPRRHKVRYYKSPGVLDRGYAFIVATYSMAKEALDLDVDTLVMAAPPPRGSGPLLQCVGRVIRGHGKRSLVLARLCRR